MKKLAYFTSLILFYSIAFLLLFVMVFSMLSYFEYKFGIQIPFVEVIENRAKVHVPLLGLRINVPFNYGILIMWSAMLYYAIYFYAFKNFLKVFIEKKIFETKPLKRLRFFMILNLVPLVYIIVFTASFLVRGVRIRLEDDYFIVLAHLAIAFLIYLYLDVLKKGKHIQEENDLTI
ncbi:DUF2975 domain-containing protein [Seonamhaeicola maritimus]|uniref:DUF2975 domain-containing protein n=1 Tax=Seonamhaeicola maritimus TaxID=2591822 RepID=A0A5C7GHD9_9FLAO|nr:DUF2975 domain-containing protein [Seonamhaeicola maritimus]TXG37008.1 DUF2975 domain-containing protein [Seonamhaeicola maritimus]